jgi:hypothetical protein
MEDSIIGTLCGVTIALLVIGALWLALRRRRELEKQVKAWPELARRTGLTYSPASGSQQGRSAHLNRPSVRGKYRGHYVSVDLVTRGNPEEPMWHVYQNTSIGVHVDNRASFWLSIRPKMGLSKQHTSNDVSSGNRDFDRCVSVEGWPRKYRQMAARLIVHRYPRLMGWLMHNDPCIDLRGALLVCWQNGEVTEVEDQIALLDLLCDLAELAEGMGIKVIQARKQARIRQELTKESS